ncbi:hypothetical protein SDC9_111552 [bioreactor metagenome]|uniref:Uncharacterized protein n=1 Tax=bioreactor metagenome TaxID=1076179 RepID=A0A645BS93_9ZZZZ
MTGIECLLGSLDDRPYRDLADNRLKLHFRQQGRGDRNTSVILLLALLHSAAHDLGYRHTHDSYCIQGFLELIELALPADDDHLGHRSLAAGFLYRRNLCYRNCKFLRHKGAEHRWYGGHEVGIA